VFRFTGKSVIRAICRESAMCGCQRATGAMLLVRRNCGGRGWCGRHCGAALAGFLLPPVPLLERAPLTAGSRPTRIKADCCDGRRDSQGESFELPVFAGDRGENLARERSWGRALAGARFGREGRSFGGGAAGASHFWRKGQSFRVGLKASQTAHPDLLPQQAFWHLPPPIRGMDAAHQVSAQRGIASCAPASI